MIQLTMDIKLQRSAWHALAKWLWYCSRECPLDEEMTRVDGHSIGRAAAHEFVGPTASMHGIDGALYSATGRLDFAGEPGERLRIQWADIKAAWRSKRESEARWVLTRRGYRAAEALKVFLQVQTRWLNSEIHSLACSGRALTIIDSRTRQQNSFSQPHPQLDYGVRDLIYHTATNLSYETTFSAHVY